MDFNAYCRRAVIYEDRPNVHAWIVEHYGANVDMPLEEWRMVWWIYTTPTDGSTPPAVARVEPTSAYLDSRDAAGM